MDDALRISPLPASAGSPAYPQAAADAPTEPGRCEVLSLDTATATVNVGGIEYTLAVDWDSDGTVRVAWWLVEPSVRDAIDEHEDDLVEVLTDERTYQLREAC